MLLDEVYDLKKIVSEEKIITNSLMQEISVLKSRGSNNVERDELYSKIL